MAHRVGRRHRGRRSGPVAAAVAGAVVLLSVTVALAGRQPGNSAPISWTTNGPSAAAAAGGAIVAHGSPGLPGSGLPSPGLPSPGVPLSTPISNGAFAGDLLIADRGNDRLIIVDSQDQILWRFPVAGSLPAGQTFSADDAFLSPDGRTISANEEMHQVLVRIDIATRADRLGVRPLRSRRAAAGYLNTPDDAYPLANGDVTVADIYNCRILEIAPDKRIVRQWGHTGVCRDAPPFSYAEPNGDTPLADGGLLITEIRGSRWSASTPQAGSSSTSTSRPSTPPTPSSMRNGNVVVADYSSPGAVVAVTPTGTCSGATGRVAGPAGLTTRASRPAADGTIVLNDDFRHRVILLDPGPGGSSGNTAAPGSPAAARNGSTSRMA